MNSISSMVLRLMMRCRLTPVTSYFNGFPRPAGPPVSRSPGPNPYKILICGTDIANGWGVRHHDLALPGHLARSMNELTGHGVDVVVAADPRMVGIKSVPSLLDSESLSDYDAIVIVTGLCDAAFLTSPATWRSRLAALIASLESQATPSTPIVIVGVPPISGIVSFGVRPHGLIDRRAAQLNQITEQLCRNGDRSHFLPMRELKSRQPGAGVSGPSEQFQRLAREQAAVIAPLFRAGDG